LVTKAKPNINSVDVHPQLSNNGHPVDGVLVGAGSPHPSLPTGCMKFLFSKLVVTIFSLG
jgi:hypothetical protein